MEHGTIVAQSTPIGKGAISIVRMSGDNAEAILKKCFVPYSGSEMQSNMLTLGEVSAGEIKDKAMAVIFRAPKSYTGETIAELQLHGSQEIADRVIKHLIKLGARLAHPGEFTRRAFLNGKVSLNEAEAVGDLINARSAAEINAAFSALKGDTAKELKDIYNGLVDICSSFDAAVDYPEEDVEEFVSEKALNEVRNLRKRLGMLAASYETGHKIRDGIRVALIGEPNAGKSSLMNRLLGRNRAIVTDIPGTTRDTIEECFEYRGMLFVLVDTAGLHETADAVELEGIKRTNEEAASADITVLLIPGGAEESTGINADIKVCSKCDIKRSGGMLNISALSGEGIEDLKEKLYELSSLPEICGGGATITSERHFGLVTEALSELGEAEKELEEKQLIDLAVVSIKGALSCISRITGASATEDVLDSIFSKFCVGK